MLIVRQTLTNLNMQLKKLISFFQIAFILLAMTISSYGYSKTESSIQKLDRIIAVVDQDVITEKELQEKINSVISNLKNQKIEIPSESVLRKQVMERLIANSIQIQLAFQTGLKINDAQVDKTIERIAEKNKLNVVDFKKTLEKDGTNFYKFREEIRNEITIAQLKEREVDSKIVITDGEIDNFLNAQSKEIQDEYEVAHILIRVPEDVSPEKLEKLKNKAEEASKQIQSGKNFTQVSAAFSETPNALEGGSLGWKKASDLPTLFVDALKKIEVGLITPILRSPNGFHILKLINKKGSSAPHVIEQIHVRHILIKLSEITSENEGRQKLMGIKERLENGIKFEDMAKQYSEDPSATNGGDLGWINPGDTVPEFEKTMKQLNINQISDPIKTPFGWHLIQVLEKRSQDMSKESARIQARQQIKMRKSEEAYQDWLQELRDRSFVELRLEDNF
ncbi:peptidylprolyl isomerase [Candidatus Methylopumilus planktonicus]|uniref:peptidylprolyl isomerase n=1 Tax=Candidatus Methylopumilus planktonicus TaxID=1581557 RepID=UPI00294FFB21|nr:peptidylprolyl isomerase [Candidatus Methylopumilus planktonicus]